VGTGYDLNAIAAHVTGARARSARRAARSEPRRDPRRRSHLLAVNAFPLQINIGASTLAAVAFDQWQGRRT
jgi:hypothetical protein